MSSHTFVLNGEKVTVVGLSAGSLVVNEVMRDMIATAGLGLPRAKR